MCDYNQEVHAVNQMLQLPQLTNIGLHSSFGYENVKYGKCKPWNTSDFISDPKSCFTFEYSSLIVRGT